MRVLYSVHPVHGRPDLVGGYHPESGTYKTGTKVKHVDMISCYALYSLYTYTLYSLYTYTLSTR
jgi:hypothetical protein